MQHTQFIPDENLRSEILAVFAADSRTSSADLRVGVLNGIAHLAGTVGSLVIRTAAEEMAIHVRGIHGVVNRIESPGAPSPARTVNLDLKNKE